jgi:hypothetical protein
MSARCISPQETSGAITKFARRRASETTKKVLLPGFATVLKGSVRTPRVILSRKADDDTIVRDVTVPSSCTRIVQDGDGTVMINKTGMQSK